MRFYLDTEYDGHNGPLISMALIREDKQRDIYILCARKAENPWVRENVIPHLNNHKARYQVHTMPERAGTSLREFLLFEDDIDIRCDSVTDLIHFSRAYSTADNGDYVPNPKQLIRFTVINDDDEIVIPGAVKHNAWWDAMGLLEKDLLRQAINDEDDKADMDKLINALCHPTSSGDHS